MSNTTLKLSPGDECRLLALGVAIEPITPKAPQSAPDCYRAYASLKREHELLWQRYSRKAREARRWKRLAIACLVTMAVAVLAAVAVRVGWEL